MSATAIIAKIIDINMFVVFRGDARSFCQNAGCEYACSEPGVVSSGTAETSTPSTSLDISSIATLAGREVGAGFPSAGTAATGVLGVNTGAGLAYTWATNTVFLPL